MRQNRIMFIRAICWIAVLASGLVLAAPGLSQTAQTAPLGGQVLNGLTGQPVPGVTITLEGSDEPIATTDLAGNFRVDLAPGTYTVVVSKEGFQTQSVTDVRVVAGQVGNFAAVLIPSSEDTISDADSESAFGDTVTVEAQGSDVSTEAALLTERKQAAQISDSIGADEIGKTTGGDAAGVLKRVTGISLQDDKFVYVRGLGDRYSNTTVNGSKIPSTEFEKKVVPLDLFPTDLLQKITVSKSYTVDKPGDFAAGFVELQTLEFPSREQGSLELSTSYDSVTTGEQFLEYGDGLSFSGSGGQGLPSGIPSDSLVRQSPFREGGYTPAELEELGETLAQGTWQPSVGGDAPLNTGYSLSYGNTVGKLGLVLSANYGNDYTTREERRAIYTTAAGDVVPLHDFEIDYGLETVRQSYVANLAYQLSSNNHVKLRSLYTVLGESEGRTQFGFFSDINANLRDFRVSFQEQDILNSQLSGEHFLPSVWAGSLIEWKVAHSQAATEENRRESNYRELSDDVFIFTDNAQSGFLYFNDLADDLTDAAADWTSFLIGDNVHGEVKAGLAYTENTREFDGRRLRFFHRGTAGVDLTQPVADILVPENIDSTGFEIEEITRPTDAYDGDHEVVGAYGQVDVAWGDWRFIGGLRAEESQIDVTTIDRTRPDLPTEVTTVDDTDFLPALSLVYSLTPDQNVRLAASQTVNRPEFRELAPFKFTHIVGGYAVTGNPELTSATIRSYDLRWEWFPGSGEVLAASVFYKDFDDPIESIIQAGAEPIETYSNAAAAENIGFELEARRNLGSLWEGLEAWTGIFNYTWVDSEIEIDPDSTVLTNPTRPLAGQPDNVVNAVLEYTRPTSGTGVRLLVNYTGEKVSLGGTFGLPDVIEEDRTTLDAVWRQDLNFLAPGLALKLSGSNLTDEEREWTQSGETFRLYQTGRKISFSLSYDLF